MRGKLRYLLGVMFLSLSLLTGCRPAQEAVRTATGASVAAEQEIETIEEETGDVQEPEEEGEAEDVQEPEEEDEPGDEDALEESKGDTSREDAPEEGGSDASGEDVPEEDGSYTSKEDVAAYLNIYGHLPDNFITKKDAKALGWDSKQGNLSEVAPGMSIGGDYFGNYEGILPKKKGRDYHECDIDSDGGYRGAKRIVYSNDGLIYYTEDHYETFELLYGEE